MPQATPSPATPSGTTGLPTTVLLVDDQPIIGEAVRRLLAGEEDVVFHFCRDASAALEAAAESAPSVILQDLVMPVVDGLDVVSRFRADPRLCHRL